VCVAVGECNERNDGVEDERIVSVEDSRRRRGPKSGSVAFPANNTRGG